VIRTWAYRTITFPTSITHLINERFLDSGRVPKMEITLHTRST